MAKRATAGWWCRALGSELLQALGSGSTLSRVSLGPRTTRQGWGCQTDIPPRVPGEPRPKHKCGAVRSLAGTGLPAGDLPGTLHPTEILLCGDACRPCPHLLGWADQQVSRGIHLPSCSGCSCPAKVWGEATPQPAPREGHAVNACPAQPDVGRSNELNPSPIPSAPRVKEPQAAVTRSASKFSCTWISSSWSPMGVPLATVKRRSARRPCIILAGGSGELLSPSAPVGSRTLRCPHCAAA